MLKNTISILLSAIMLIGTVNAQPTVSTEEVPVTEFAAPNMVVRPITFNIGLLEIKAEFVDEGAAAQYKGYLLKRSDVALLQTVVDSLPDDFSRECDSRIGACLDEVTSCQTDCDQRVEQTISELHQTKDLLVSERELHSSTKMRYTLYGFGGAIVSSLTTALIIKIFN